MRGEVVHPARLSKGFQDSVVEVLVEKAIRASKAFGAKQLLLAGGVAANKGLREALSERCVRVGLPLLVPPLSLCTDNAAMIAAAAFLKWERDELSSLDLKAGALLSLEEWSVKESAMRS
jgi:N6-L-threonylcarbamoyladenine synthase